MLCGFNVAIKGLISVRWPLINARNCNRSGLSWFGESALWLWMAVASKLNNGQLPDGSFLCIIASGYFAVSWIPLSTTYDTVSVSVFCTADLLQLHTLGHRLRYDKIQRLSLTLKVWCFNRYNRWFAAQTVVLLLCRLITSIMSRQQWWWHNNVSYVMVAYDTLTLAIAGAVLSSTRYDYSRPIQ